MRRWLCLERLGSLFVGVCAVAIVLGRGASPGPARVPGPACYALIPGYRYDPARLGGGTAAPDVRQSLMLNTATGGVRPWRTQESDAVYDGSCSPWVDENGRSEIIAIWRDRVDATRPARSGLVRVSCPDGLILDRVDLDCADLDNGHRNASPLGPICWLPGTAARVIFASVNGELYRFDFEESAAAMDHHARPSPLLWRINPPFRSRFYLREPFMPTDRRMACELIVSVHVCDPEDGTSLDRTTQFWRLTLDPQATAIVAAARLFEPAGPEAPGLQPRFPVVAGLSDGSLVLAYMAGNWTRGYQLRVAAVQFDARTGAPRAWENHERILADGCIGIPPVFSADGRSVYCCLKTDEALPRFLRLDVSSPSVTIDSTSSDQNNRAGVFWRNLPQHFRLSGLALGL